MTSSATLTPILDRLATLANGRAIDRAEVPELSFDDFQQAILAAVQLQQRVVALFGMLDPDPEIVPLTLSWRTISNPCCGWLERASAAIAFLR
jgi:hypothetical protein